MRSTVRGRAEGDFKRANTSSFSLKREFMREAPDHLARERAPRSDGLLVSDTVPFENRRGHQANDASQVIGSDGII